MYWRRIKLTDEEKKELSKAEGEIKKPHLIKRVHCIKLKDKGWKHKEIGEYLSITVQRVSIWLRLYTEQGVKGLIGYHRQGRISILKAEHQTILRARHKEKPFDTAKEAKEFIEKEFGIKFHLHWVQKILKKNSIFPIRRPG